MNPDADAARRLELVNATRGADRQLTELHPVDAASVLADPDWAEMIASDAEIRQMAERRAPGAQE